MRVNNKKGFERKKEEEEVEEGDDKEERDQLYSTEPAASSAGGGKMDPVAAPATSINALGTRLDQLVAAAAAPATSVFALRTRLDELRQRTGDGGAVREMLVILRDDLGVRADVTFRTLLETGIGRPVSWLSKQGDPAVAAAAMPILERWGEIEAATPLAEKLAIKVTVKAAAATKAARAATNAAVSPAKRNIPPGQGPLVITMPTVSSD